MQIQNPSQQMYSVDAFKREKRRAKIKKIISFILLIIATLLIIGAIFFIAKAFKSKHDAIKAEKDNSTYDDLKSKINTNDGQEIISESDCKKMKYVYNKEKDSFDVYEASKNGNFNKYKTDTIKHTSAEDIEKLHNNFPEFMKLGAPILASGITASTCGGLILSNANNEVKNAETKMLVETQNQQNILNQIYNNKTPNNLYQMYKRQYNAPVKPINNTVITNPNIIQMEGNANEPTIK